MSKKWGREFGDCQLLGDHGSRFFLLSPEKQAKRLAWSEACPVGPDLFKPTDKGGRGPEEMRRRYGEVIFWMGYLMEDLQSHGRQDLVAAMTSRHPRQPGEPLGKHSENWLPRDAKTHVYRSAAGYILPRLLTEFIHLPGEDYSCNLFKALRHFENCSHVAANEAELVVYFANDLAVDLKDQGKEAQSLQILRRLLGVGKLEEDNLHAEYRRIFDFMILKSKPLATLYQSLPPEEISRLNLYTPDMQSDRITGKASRK